MRHRYMLDPAHTALAIVDMQEAFRAAISDFAETAARIALVAHAAQLLDIPVVVTEQYPRGLGRTAGEIKAVLPPESEPIEKTAFSSCGAPEFGAKLSGLNIQHVLLCGIEAHICVNQTAHDLLARSYQVHLLEDCITARAPANREIAFAKMRMSGALPSCTEMALFELMRDAKHEHFRTIQKLIR